MSSGKRHLTAFLLTLGLTSPLLLLIWQQITDQQPMAPPQPQIVPVALTELAPPQQTTPQNKVVAPAKTQHERPPKAERPNQPPEPVAAPKPQTVAKPAVVKPRPQAHPSKAKPQIKPKPTNTPAQDKAKPERPTATTRSAPEQTAAATTPSSPRPTVDPAIKRRYLEALRHTVAQLAHHSYPYRARRRGQQGTVTLSFTLHADGRITNLRQTGSSGHTILDQAARSVITEEMNMRFQPFPNGMNLDKLQVTIPIRYRLH
ncbi:MAG TPA: energy transducer TonB [Sulfurivirga caldicuralii]|nr:energy transducer TonB [Sulfurivirga caldicuralii]